MVTIGFAPIKFHYYYIIIIIMQLKKNSRQVLLVWWDNAEECVPSLQDSVTRTSVTGNKRRMGCFHFTRPMRRHSGSHLLCINLTHTYCDQLKYFWFDGTMRKNLLRHYTRLRDTDKRDGEQKEVGLFSLHPPYTQTFRITLIAY